MVLLFVAFLSEASAATTRVLVTVANGDEKPVPNATVRFVEEGERHRVNSFDGSWEGSELYPSKDVTKVFAKGDEVHLEVMAPGYGYWTQTVAIEKTKNQVRVTLAPISLDAPPDASPEEAATYASLTGWMSAEAAWAADPSAATIQASTDARLAVAAASKAWLATKPEGARAAFALDTCRTASQRSSDCE